MVMKPESTETEVKSRYSDSSSWCSDKTQINKKQDYSSL